MQTWIFVPIALFAAQRAASADVGDNYKATGYEVVQDDYDGRLERACTRFPEAEEQAKLPEWVKRQRTLSAGLSVPLGSDRGYGVGVHVRGEEEIALPGHPGMFVRGIAEPMWAGRFGAIGEAAIGLSIYHRYGTFYRGSRDYLVTTTTEVDRGDYTEKTTTTQPVHVPAICTVAGRDVQAFAGIHAGVFAGKDVRTDPTTMLATHAATEGWGAIELGLTDRKRAADGSWREETLALAYDVIDSRFGGDVRVAAPLWGAYSMGEIFVLGGSGGPTVFIVTASWGKRWR